jgi:endonuclease YncB( thermonuclease family)
MTLENKKELSLSSILMSICCTLFPQTIEPQSENKNQSNQQQPTVTLQPVETVSFHHDQLVPHFTHPDQIAEASIKKGLVLQGQVTYVMDGDTIKFYHIDNPTRNVPSNIQILKQTTLTLRIAGIDTPEIAKFGNKGQEYANESKNFTESFTKGKRVKIQIYSKDQYGRLVGSVDSNGVDLALTLVEHGLADIYTGRGAEFGTSTNETRLKKALVEAKIKKIGMWNDPNFQSPSEYKKAAKQSASVNKIH